MSVKKKSVGKLQKAETLNRKVLYTITLRIFVVPTRSVR